MPAVKVRKSFKKKPLRFKQKEIERAIRGMRRMGLSVGRVDIDPATGKFANSTADAVTTTTMTTPKPAEPKPWDREKDAAS